MTTPTLASSSLFVPRSSAELQAILANGRVIVDGAERIVRPVAVVDDKVQLELVADEPAPSVAGRWLTAIRAISLTATATPCLAALLFGLGGAYPVRVTLAITALLGAIILQIGVNLMNDAEDHRRLIDLPGTRGGAGVIQRGWLTERAVRRAAWGCLIAGLLLGVPTMVTEPGPLLALAAVALIGAAGYSGAGLGLKYHALGDLAVVVLCGPLLTIGFSLAVYGHANLSVALLGVSFGLFAVGLLHVNNLQDVDIDRARGARTVASTIGRPASRAYLVMLYVGGVTAWAVAAVRIGLPVWAVAAPIVLVAVPTIKLVVDVLKGGDLQSPVYDMVRLRAAQVHLMFGVAVCATLGLAYAVA